MYEFIFSIIMILLYYLIPFILVLIIYKYIRKNNNKRYFRNNVVFLENNLNSTFVNKYQDVSLDKLQRFNTDNIDLLKDYFYNLFLQFENAYNNLDYNKMKMLSTKELFYNYYTGINLNLKGNKKRVIENIQKEDVILFELDSSSIKQVATLMIKISYNTYMVNKDNMVVNGNKSEVVTEKFEVSFRKDFGKNQIIKCPNCSANISGSICEYCHTQIDNIEFKINSIKKIVEK